MLAIIASGALQGVEACPVQVEVNTGEIGELRFILVGLPDAAVKESQDRVFSALINSGFAPPSTRTTLNLAPGHLRKEGPIYDLPIALGLLAATRQLDAESLKDFLIAGELSLSGATRTIRGGLALAILAKKEGKRGVILPKQSAQEAALVEGLAVYGVDSLDEVVQFLKGRLSLSPLESKARLSTPNLSPQWELDFKDIKGQEALKRAVEVAVAGGHNLLMIGPPGSGKSMLAKRIPTIMPEPSLDEFLEILATHSAAGLFLSQSSHFWQRPFRSPHHTISEVGLLGGGSFPKPGEMSLSHHGVLFLDELPEFRRSTLEVMRQPLEEGVVHISRSAAKITFPCSIMLIAAMNPCPCGYMGNTKRECRCSSTLVRNYRSKISGPLLDRIDIHTEVSSLPVEDLLHLKEGESSATIRERVCKARKAQLQRFSHTSQTTCNAKMQPKEVKAYCALGASEAKILQKAMEQLQLSARAYDKILKVSRTIADLAGTEDILLSHLLEAINYRSLDRTVFY